MPNNGPETLTETPVAIYDSEDGCTSYSVRAASTNGSNVQVRVPRLHGEEWFHIPPGAEEIFRVADHGITTIMARAESGTVDILKGVVALTE